jgi:hypothetical protein
MSLAVATLADPIKANGGQFYFGTWITLLETCFLLRRSQTPNGYDQNAFR